GAWTGGSRISSCSVIRSRIRGRPPRPPCELCGDGQEEEGEEPLQGVLRQRRRDLDADGSTGDRGGPEPERRLPADVPITALTPRPGRDRRKDREQRGRLGAELPPTEREQGADAQDDAA